MSALVSTVSNVLKDRYLGPLNRQLNDEILVMQLLGLDSKNIDLDGNQAVVPVHKGRTAGVGARMEGDTLPAAGYQPFDKAVYDLKYLYGRAQFSGQAIQKTKTDAGAFIRVMTEELDRLRADLALDLARQAYGDGSGAIATISSGTASATQTITSAEPVDKGFLYANMRVDIGTAANPVASADSAVISSVSGTSVVFTASVSTTTSHVISREDNLDASSVSHEINGLQKLVSDAAATVGGINEATAGNEFWANQRQAVGGAITLSDLLLNSNKVNAKGAKSSDIVLLTTPGIVRRLFETADFKSNVRFMDGGGTLKQGFDMIKFASGAGSYSMVADRLAPWGHVYFIDKDKIKVFSPGGWDFLSRDGLTIRWVSDKDAFQAVLFRYMNLGMSRRNTSLVMSGVTDANGL